MEKASKLTTKKLIIMIAAIFLACLAAIGVLAYLRGSVKQVASQDDYGYVNTDETKAEADAGITIDGVLDEKEYQDNNWLYLRNDNGNATVDIATTSYYGEKGMYFVYDVTESTPIYVNLNRSSAMNSCVELYLALSDVTNMDRSEIFEIDLLPTGDMVFKQRNGKGAFMDVATTDDKMAYLGATTKGGEINTEDCHGYCLEFFIPWEYLDFLGMDVKSMKTDYVFVNTAHITSYNYAGTAETDRYWYSFAQQLGGNGWGNVSLYYRFDKDGVIGTVPVELVEGDHYKMEGVDTVIPGVKTHVTITPEKGYAINSILVNGEEYIKQVSYNEDGSISLDVRGVKEGLTISASAEAVTEGNKTINGTVKVHKVGGDSLNGVTASYVGPNGEKPITLDAQGNFALTDLKQGFYKITVEKEGYEKIERGICLNRAIDTEFVLEYITFEVESGRCWQLEEVNDGIINKMGGFGSLLTTDSYKNFSVEANFKYYVDVAESLEEQDRQEQRQGIRIKFSNDKYWHIDLLYQKEKYFIQYAKATTDSIFNFRDIYVLSEEEIAKFKSEDGIQLKVVREGNRAIIYLGGNLVAVEDLDKEYTNLTAKVGFESWGPYTDVRTMKYKISSKVGVDVDGLYFGYHKGWDVTKQFEGVVSQPKGGNTVWLRFYEKLANMDLTFRVKDNPLVGGENPRTSIRFEFDNKETFIASICESAKGVVQIQKYPCTYTNNKWAGSYYNFTDAEKAQYKTEEGIDFRVVRNGTEILFFIGGEYKTSVDLSEIIKGDTPAIVSIQHVDDKGVPYVMPFSISEKVENVTIAQKESNGKEVKTEKGTTVVVSAEEGYYIKVLSLNGKDVSADLNWDGTYVFIAEEANYTMKATLAKRIFETDYGWDLLEQNQGTKDGVTTGVVSLPNGGTTSSNLNFIEKYADMDLTWRVKDHPNSDATNTTAPRTSFEFIFDEVLTGEKKTFTLSVSDSNKGVVQIQNTSGLKDKAYTSYYNFDEDETAKYRSAEGVDIRIVRDGTDFILFVDGELKAVVDLSKYIKADTKATVRINHNDDNGVEIEMPYAVTDKVDIEKIYFGYHKAWDVTNQFEGSVTQPKGGNTVWLRFFDEITTMDLNINVLDNPNVDGDAPRTSIRFEFDNGETFLASISESNKGIVQLQNLKSTTNEKDYSAYFNFTAEEQAQYQTEEGIDFRIVRKGTEILFFIGGEYQTSVDLSKFIEEDTPAVVSIQHQGDQGVPYEMQFDLKEILIPMEITDNTDADFGSLNTLFAHNGTIVANEKTLANSEYYLAAVKLDGGEEVPLNVDGNVTFNVANTSHAVEGVYKKAIFEDRAEWSLVNQNQSTENGVTSGTLSIRNGGYAGVLYLYRTTDKDGNKGFDYGDIDYTLTLQDYALGSGTPNTQIRFVFEITSGQKVLDLYVDESDGVVRIRNAQHNTMQIGSKTWYEFTEAEEALYKDGGIDVRVLREGKKISLYVGGIFKRSIDLTGHIENDSMARVALFHDGDSGVQVDIPYKLSVPVKKIMGGQYLSILGDSVSMCAEMPENSNNNSTTAINHAQDIYGNPRNFGINKNWKLTYWGQSIVDNDIKLLVNNSVSGGLVHDYPHVSVMTGANGKKQENFVPGYIRSAQLHDNTNEGIQNGTEPDIIYLYMGTEDYKQKNNLNGFTTAYKNTLDTITREYENAEVFCFTVIPYCPKSQGNLSTNMTNRWKSHNDAIREVSSQYENVTLVDLAKYIDETNYKNYYPNVNWGDLVTPNADGHNVIAEVLQAALESQYAMKSNITIEASNYGTITTSKTSCDFGETVVITAPKKDEVATGYYLDGLMVNGEVKAFDLNGTYSFTTEKVSYVIEGIYKKKIFKDNDAWDLSNQNQGTDAKGITTGVVALTNGGYGALWLYRSTDTSYDYGDIDLALTLKDNANGTGTPVTQVDFILDTVSGQKVLQLYLEEVSGKVQVGNKEHANSFKIGNNVFFDLSDDEAVKYKADGIKFRVLREGVKLSFFVDGVFKKSVYMDAFVESDTKLPAAIENNTMARVRIQHAGDENTRVEIPYELSFPQKQTLSGKYVSILGDGISMSTGVPLNADGSSTAGNNSTISVNNATDIYGADINQGIGSDWTKLYWGKSLTTNGMNLLVNNSVSKGLLHANPHTSTYGNDASKLQYYVPGYQRVGQLAANQGTLNGTQPDIIYLYMGTEDRKQSNPTGFEAKYKETLDAIATTYPNAEVFCFTTMAYYDSGYRGIGQTSGSSAGRMTTVNDAIRKLACQYENVTLVDIADIITINNYETYFPETVTRVAPRVEAHNVIATRLQKALESQFSTISQ